MNEIRLHIPKSPTRPSFGDWDQAKDVSDALQAIERMSGDAVRIADEVVPLDDREGVDFRGDSPGHVFVLARDKQYQGVGFVGADGKQPGGKWVKQDAEVIYDTESGELNTVRVRQTHEDGNQEELHYTRETGVQSFLFSNAFGKMSASVDESTGETSFERAFNQPPAPPAQAEGVEHSGAEMVAQPLAAEPPVEVPQAMLAPEIWMLAR